jgi:hypothetical protein
MDIIVLRGERLEILDDFRRTRAELREASLAISVTVSRLLESIKRKPHVGEIVTNSLTKETGRILRIVNNADIRERDTSGRKPTGVSYIVSVPADSPAREALWNESVLDCRRRGFEAGMNGYASRPMPYRYSSNVQSQNSACRDT